MGSAIRIIENMNRATQAIERSISHNEIVTIDATKEDIETLIAECEDNVDAGEVHEYWGTDDDGNEWRVHLRVDAIEVSS